MTIDTAVLADLCKRNDIVRLRVFGSFARGDEAAQSDLDLIADFGSRKAYWIWSGSKGSFPSSWVSPSTFSPKARLVPISGIGFWVRRE